MNSKIKIGDVVQCGSDLDCEYAIVVKIEKDMLFVKNKKNKILRIEFDECSKLRVPAIKISIEDFDKIVNKSIMYKHRITSTWRLVLDQQPKLIKFYANDRTAIICRLFSCVKFVKNVTKHESFIGKLIERQFYIKAYINHIL